ncbi:MAG: hypothetical protein AAF351_14550 [Pseudomonadota bacterium]
MDIAWIQVFVLTLSECVAPAGKTVCQEQELQMQFLTQAECETALEEIISLKDQFDNVIVNRRKSGCTASARQSETFASADAVKTATGGDDWVQPEDSAAVTATRVSHNERLAEMKTCDESRGVAPCKIGNIIIEGASSGQPVEVWRGD